LTHISVPPLGADAGVGYSTVAIGADSKALARAAALVHAGEQIDEARVVLACLGPAPLRHAAVEAALRGAPTTAEAVQTAVAAIDGDLSPAPDVHASPEYRIEMARVAARRAVCQAIGKVG
jgi:CO/xanthine dehydrogenase FAD-binding subunit